VAVWQRVFAIEDVALTHDKFVTAMELAERLGPQAGRTLAQLRAAHSAFTSDLDALARSTARVATVEMRNFERATQVRGGTGRSPHLRVYLTARPLRPASGSVGVGDEAVLNRAVNPMTPRYGSYWRAQEFGTGNVGAAWEPKVPSQIGRELRGYFFAAGYRDPEVPRAIYRGGGGPHPLFLPGRPQDFGPRTRGGIGPRGGVGGRGVISVEIKGRHFIRDGANEAERFWLAEIARAQRDAIARLAPIL
jgi:hypothetical protein